MIELLEYSKNVKFVEHDYIFEDLEHFKAVHHILTPKFEGEWEIIFVNTSLVETKELLDDESLYSGLNIHIYLPRNKLELVLKEYPKYIQKKLSPYDLYKQFLADLKHPIDKKAASYAYQASSNNIDDLYKTLTQIDLACTKEKITLTDIQKEFSYTKHIYTNQVISAFILRNKLRFNYYETWLNELGMSYAYNSAYKYIKKLVHDKSCYLNGEDVRNPVVSRMDGISISILYMLFVNSTDYHQLEGIFYTFEHMNQNMYQTIINTKCGL